MSDFALTAQSITLPWIDLVVVAAYLLAMAGMGVYFSRKNRDTEGYFLGKRRIPGWAIGLSMLSTSISSITFLALPAAAYVKDYRLIVPNLMMPVAAVFVVLIFVPLYRRCCSTSAFEYLEMRFGSGVRLYAVGVFLLAQLVRVATVLYLVAIPVSILTNIPIMWVVVIGGLILCFYTVAGGFDAVIWTDVVQTFVLLGGGIVCLAIIIYDIPGSVGSVFRIGWENHKFSLGEWHWDLSERTAYTMAILGLVNFGSEMIGNQNWVQRYLAASSDREAKKATALAAVMSLPTWLFFFFIGTCLYAFYQIHPEPAVAQMNGEEVVSHFLKVEVPTGINGLIVAGCLAAAMSTLSSCLNSFSSVVVTDIIRRYTNPQQDERFYLRAAKWVSAAVGLAMILGAVILHFVPRESMANLGFIAGSLFGGCLLSVYLLGFFMPRVGYGAIMTGLVVAIVANVYLTLNQFAWLPNSWQINVHPFWTRTIVNLVLIVVTLPALWWFRDNMPPKDGLTYQSIRRPGNQWAISGE